MYIHKEDSKSFNSLDTLYRHYISWSQQKSKVGTTFIFFPSASSQVSPLYFSTLTLTRLGSSWLQVAACSWTNTPLSSLSHKYVGNAISSRLRRIESSNLHNDVLDDWPCSGGRGWKCCRRRRTPPRTCGPERGTSTALVDLQPGEMFWSAVNATSFRREIEDWKRCSLLTVWKSNKLNFCLCKNENRYLVFFIFYKGLH